MKKHWSVEPSAYRMEKSHKPVVIIYDPTPGGKNNGDGTTSHALRFPALALTEWVSDPEEIAAKIAEALNKDDAQVARIKELEAVVEAFMRRAPEREYLPTAYLTIETMMSADYCPNCSRYSEHHQEHHESNCPWVMARATKNGA